MKYNNCTRRIYRYYKSQNLQTACTFIFIKLISFPQSSGISRNVVLMCNTKIGRVSASRRKIFSYPNLNMKSKSRIFNAVQWNYTPWKCFAGKNGIVTKAVLQPFRQTVSVKGGRQMSDKMKSLYACISNSYYVYFIYYF